MGRGFNARLGTFKEAANTSLLPDFDSNPPNQYTLNRKFQLKKE